MSNRTAPIAMVAWIVMLGAVGLVLLVTLLSAVLSAAILVDQIPGGDAGLATTPELDSAYQTMYWTLPALMALIVIGIATPLIARRGRRRRTTVQ